MILKEQQSIPLCFSQCPVNKTNQEWDKINWLACMEPTGPVISPAADSYLWASCSLLELGSEEDGCHEATPKFFTHWPCDSRIRLVHALSCHTFVFSHTHQDQNPIAESLSEIYLLSLRKVTCGQQVMPSEKPWGRTCGMWVARETAVNPKGRIRVWILFTTRKTLIVTFKSPELPKKERWNLRVKYNKSFFHYINGAASSPFIPLNNVSSAQPNPIRLHWSSFFF